MGCGGPDGDCVFLPRSSLAEAPAKEPRLLAVPGVRLVALAFCTAAELATDHIEGWIDEQLFRWERAQRAPRTTQAAILAE